MPEFLVYFKNQTGNSIKTIRSDNGIEFTNHRVNTLLKNERIKHEYTVNYTPQQNGRAEKEFRTILESVRAMLAGSVSVKNFWAQKFF